MQPRCIFSYDGTSRIRFAGESAHIAQSQPDRSGPPKMTPLYRNCARLSSIQVLQNAQRGRAWLAPLFGIGMDQRLKR